MKIDLARADEDVRALTERFGGAVTFIGVDRGRGVRTVVVEKSVWRAAAEFLKTRGYDYLTDVTSVDRLKLPDWEKGGEHRRFEVIAHVTSLSRGTEIRLKTLLDDGGGLPELDSLVPVWGAANLLEREVFDLMGIRFAGHPDLRRILLSADWKGHPLRKDYPVEGYDLWNPLGRS